VRSVKTGGNVQVFLTTAKMIPLVAIIVIGLGSIDAGELHFASSTSEAASRGLFAIITAGISSTVWSYAGFTNILYMGGEIKDPQRTLPIALFGSLAFVTVAYTLIATGTNAVVPFADLVGVREAFVNPFQYVGFLAGIAGAAFAIVVFINMIGALNAGIMAQPRLEYAIARDGLFFEIFGRLHPTYLTPHYSIIIQCALAVVLFLLGDLENMLGYFTISYLLQNALVYGTIFFLRRQEDYHPTYRAPLWWLMTLLSIGLQIYIGVGTFLAYPEGGILACLGLIASGVPLYWYFARRKKIS